MIKGTQSDFVITHLLKISKKLRMKVNEITLDMAGSMKRIAQRCFPDAVQVIDRFHVQKLSIEALQEIRIRHRWEAIEMENNPFNSHSAETEVFANGDTGNSSWQEAGIYYIKAVRNGLCPRNKELRSFYPVS